MLRFSSHLSRVSDLGPRPAGTYQPGGENPTQSVLHPTHSCSVRKRLPNLLDQDGVQMLERMIGAARLAPDVYEDVEADRGATGQAAVVVVLVAIATGIGGLGIGGLGGLIAGVVYGLISWAAWAYVTYAVGTSLFPTPETKADWGELARTTGFAQSPGVLRVFAFIPGFGPVIALAASLWQFAAMVVAVRQALDYRSTWRALGVVAVGFVVVVVFQGLLYALL